MPDPTPDPTQDMPVASRAWLATGTEELPPNRTFVETIGDSLSCSARRAGESGAIGVRILIFDEPPPKDLQHCPPGENDQTYQTPSQAADCAR